MQLRSNSSLTERESESYTELAENQDAAFAFDPADVGQRVDCTNHRFHIKGTSCFAVCFGSVNDTRGLTGPHLVSS